MGVKCTGSCVGNILATDDVVAQVVEDVLISISVPGEFLISQSKVRYHERAE
jgi:hypothetical protein